MTAASAAAKRLRPAQAALPVHQTALPVQQNGIKVHQFAALAQFRKLCPPAIAHLVRFARPVREVIAIAGGLSSSAGGRRMDWMRVRIENVIRANQRVRSHEVVADTCKACHRRVIETNCRGLCPYCSVAALLACGTAGQIYAWERTGSL
jgi:hypothetical protein